jgi:hypothetical protein
MLKGFSLSLWRLLIKEQTPCILIESFLFPNIWVRLWVSARTAVCDYRNGFCKFLTHCLVKALWEFLFLDFWGSNLGPCACQVHKCMQTLPLSCIISPGIFLEIKICWKLWIILYSACDRHNLSFLSFSRLFSSSSNTTKKPEPPVNLKYNAPTSHVTPSVKKRSSTLSQLPGDKSKAFDFLSEEWVFSRLMIITKVN